MAVLYFRCAGGVNSFVIHSASSSAYPMTCSSTSWAYYTYFASAAKDCYIDTVTTQSGSGTVRVRVYSSSSATTPSSSWALSTDKYISTTTSPRYIEIYADPPASEGYANVICGSGCRSISYAYVHNGTRYPSSGTYATSTSSGAIQCDHMWLGYAYATDNYSLPWGAEESGSGTWYYNGSSYDNYVNGSIYPTYSTASYQAKSVEISFTYTPPTTYYLYYALGGGTGTTPSTQAGYAGNSVTMAGSSGFSHNPRTYDSSSGYSTIYFQYNGSGQATDTRTANKTEHHSVTQVFNKWFMTNTEQTYSAGATYTFPSFNDTANATWKDGTDTTTSTDYGTITLPTPTAWAGHTFLGWYDVNNIYYGTGGTVVNPHNTPITGDTLYAHWQVTIGKFYWDGNDGSTDSAIIFTGGAVSNLTANMWNRLNAKIHEIDSSYTYTPIVSGDTFTATLFNQARNGIDGLSGHGSLPSTVSQGGTIYASYFTSTTSLRNALNTAIDNL